MRNTLAVVSTALGRATRLIGVALVALLIAAIVGTMALVRFSANGSAPLTAAQVVKLIQPSVLAVSVTPFRSGATEGSGFVYGSPNRILTSAQLVARALSVSVMDSSGEPSPRTATPLDRLRSGSRSPSRSAARRFELRRPAHTTTPAIPARKEGDARRVFSSSTALWDSSPMT